MAQRPKVLITNAKVPEIAFDLLSKSCDLIVNQELPYPSKEEIVAKCPGVEAIFWCTKYRFDQSIIDAAGPKLKVVGTMSAGADHLDIEAIKRNGIILGNTPTVLDNAVAETAIFLALGAAKRVLEGRQAIEKGEWVWGVQWMLGQQLAGSTIGIVGLGGIGCAIAKRLKAFEVANILYTGHKEKEEGKKLGAIFVSMDRLLEESDFVFVACPLTDETRNMFNENLFKKMKKTSVFVNIGRGGVVQQEDLIKALKNGTIFAAGLDVMTPEPLPPDHELLKLPNCVIIPHLGSATYRTRSAMAEMTAQNILRGLAGKTLLSRIC